MRLRRRPRGLDLTTVPAPPPPVPPNGAQVIRTRGLPDGYVPPSTSLRPGEIPVTLPGPDFGNPGTPQSVVVHPELAAILDRAAGRVHSATGPVMACLAEILAAHRRMIAEDIAQRIADACPWPDAHQVDSKNPACNYAHAAKIAREKYPPTREQP